MKTRFIGACSSRSQPVRTSKDSSWPLKRVDEHMFHFVELSVLAADPSHFLNKEPQPEQVIRPSHPRKRRAGDLKKSRRPKKSATSTVTVSADHTSTAHANQGNCDQAYCDVRRKLDAATSIFEDNKRTMSNWVELNEQRIQALVEAQQRIQELMGVVLYRVGQRVGK